MLFPSKSERDIEVIAFYQKLENRYFCLCYMYRRASNSSSNSNEKYILDPINSTKLDIHPRPQKKNGIVTSFICLGFKNKSKILMPTKHTK